MSAADEQEQLRREVAQIGLRRRNEQLPWSRLARLATKLACEEANVQKIEWGEPGEGFAFTHDEDGRIRAPLPTNAQQLSILLHEIGHQRLHRGLSETSLISEIEASTWVLSLWDAFALPDRDMAQYQLRRGLKAHWQPLLASGEKSVSELEALIPADLKPFGESGLYSSDRERWAAQAR